MACGASLGLCGWVNRVLVPFSPLACCLTSKQAHKLGQCGLGSRTVDFSCNCTIKLHGLPEIQVRTADG